MIVRFICNRGTIKVDVTYAEAYGIKRKLIPGMDTEKMIFDFHREGRDLYILAKNLCAIEFQEEE